MFFSEQHFGKRVSEKAIQNVCRVCVPETNFPVKEGDLLAERMKEFSDFYDNWRSNKFLERGGMTGKEEKFINISEVVLVLVNS